MGDILIIEDDLSLRELLEITFQQQGHSVSLAEDGNIGFDKAVANRFDLIISDIRMPGKSGLEVLQALRKMGKHTTFILISAYADKGTAVEAMHAGAYDLLPKPFKVEDLIATVDSALTHKNLDKERQDLDEMVKTSQKFGRLIGSSPVMLPVYDMIKKASTTSTSILITGESGTGKELVARAIHDNSTRSEKEFVAINCGGMPEQLVESELFGHKKGSFTGAHTDKQGLMSVANGGTLFLDELAELTLPMQVKLLRVVQERAFRPLGGNVEQEVDLRFISATNKNLEQEIRANKFREDLYYRLNVINIRIPPLRERPEDIPVLAQYFLEKYSKQQNKDLRKLSTYALTLLSNYNFPGNVRELENIIERSVALEQSNIILPESLLLSGQKSEPGFIRDFARGDPNPQTPRTLLETMDFTPVVHDVDPLKSILQLPEGGLENLLIAVEGYYLYNAHISSYGIRSRTATLLGISPWRLRVRLNAFGFSKINDRQLTAIPEEIYTMPKLYKGFEIPEWNNKEIDLDRILHEVEAHYIQEALVLTNNNQTEAARILELSRRSFQHRLNKSNVNL
ncbi:MAG: sigma 54-interacting transcriptional regulator [Deltaproteobacteria bacterium]|nr:sigma 54-interacting transcriptional regulator [Deltaproteobacteria bacterium]